MSCHRLKKRDIDLRLIILSCNFQSKNSLIDSRYMFFDSRRNEEKEPCRLINCYTYCLQTLPHHLHTLYCLPSSACSIDCLKVSFEYISNNRPESTHFCLTFTYISSEFLSMICMSLFLGLYSVIFSYVFRLIHCRMFYCIL